MAAMTRNRAQADLLAALGRAGTWMTRADLATTLDWSEVRLDDELGDLVMAAAVEFNERARSYRLVGPPLARQALRKVLVEPSCGVAMTLGRQMPDKRLYRVGIARRVAQQADEPARLVMAEIELPYPQGKGPQALQEFLAGVWAALDCQAMGGPGLMQEPAA